MLQELRGNAIDVHGSNMEEDASMGHPGLVVHSDRCKWVFKQNPFLVDTVRALVAASLSYPTDARRKVQESLCELCTTGLVTTDTNELKVNVDASVGSSSAYAKTVVEMR